MHKTWLKQAHVSNAYSIPLPVTLVKSREAALITSYFMSEEMGALKGDMKYFAQDPI